MSAVLKRGRRRFAKVFVAGLLVIGAAVVVPPTAVADGTAHFSLTSNSGRAGSVTYAIAQDPCPSVPAGKTQAVDFTFQDSAGAEFDFGGPQTNQDGTWNDTAAFIPERRIMQFQPGLKFQEDAATGQGWIKAKCWIVPGGDTVQEYAPQPFTVTDRSLQISLSSTRVDQGAVVRLNAIDQCPSFATSGVAVVTNFRGSYVNVPLSVVPGTGEWDSVDVTIPADFASGSYNASVTCYGGGTEHLEYMNYGAVLLKVGSGYIALGDSYSSGEGAFDYIDSQNKCHRSGQAYPFGVASDVNLRVVVFGACSGAVTDDFYVSNPKNANEPPQLDRITDAGVITLSIGGNDTGFGQVMAQCVNDPLHKGWGCSGDQSLGSSIDKALNALAGSTEGTIDGRPIHPLAALYQSVHANAPGATIYVGGYPHIFGSDKANYSQSNDAPSGALCTVLLGFSVDYADAMWLNAEADRLNAVISDQVNAARAQGVPVVYVNPTPFAGHGLCDSRDAWFNGVVLDGPSGAPESFHPTPTGHAFGYETAFAQAIAQN